MTGMVETMAWTATTTIMAVSEVCAAHCEYQEHHEQHGEKHGAGA
jgi:hypothetical protein